MNRMCVSIKMQIFALVFSYQGCASFEWVDLPQKAEASNPPPETSEFWAERIESTDPDEDGARIYIFRHPTSNRKMDAVATCGEAGPEERQDGNTPELKIVQTTSGTIATFAVACKPAPKTG
jgi:hypothetical protein